MVLVYEPAISAARHYDYIIKYSNATGNFFQGENIYQTTDTNDRWDVTVADASSFTAGDIVEQGPTADTIGTILQKAGNILTITNVVGSGFVVGSSLHLPDDSFSSTITEAQAQSDVVIAYGKIRSIDNDTLKVARLRFDGQFYSNAILVGESSGVSANVVFVDADRSEPAIGYNADVSANTITSNSLAANLQIVDSGIGYTKNENVTFFKIDDPSITGTFRVEHSGLGFGQGYFRSTRGFASSNKYLFDGEYYQEYSYEVISSIPFDKYKDVLNKVLHVAGTRAFGSVLLESDVEHEHQAAESEVAQINE
jgi:hypothetical protein